MTNYLFLDIDGVLNAAGALTHTSESRHPWPDYQLVDKDRPYAETISPSMIEQLRNLIDKHNIQVRWLTTWENRAHEFGKKIGLVSELGLEWPWHYTQDSAGIWGKHKSIRLHLAIHRERDDRIVWIDDDLHTEHEAQLWASEAGILAIAPYLHHGITPAHLHMLNEHYTKEQQ